MAPSSAGAPVPENSWIIAVTLSAQWWTWDRDHLPALVSIRAKFPPNTKTPSSSATGLTESSMPFISKPRGSSYAGVVEEFAVAAPTLSPDRSFGQPEGRSHVCVAVGGRKVQSGLLRVTYEGKESTEPAKSVPGGEEARKRRQALENSFKKGSSQPAPKQLNQI